MLYKQVMDELIGPEASAVVMHTSAILTPTQAQALNEIISNGMI